MGFGKSGPLTKRGMRPDAPLSDHAMVQHARELSLSLTIGGEARARMHDGFPGALKKISGEAHRLVSAGIAMTPAMEWLTDNIRMVETMSGHLYREKRPLLPAHDEEPRIQTLMREVVAHADAQISRDRLLLTIAAFDELQGLWMDEIWSVPQALKMEMCAAFAVVARRVLAAECDRYAAERWIQEGAGIAYIQKHPKSSAFYERALQLMHETDLPASRRALEEWLLERDTSAEQVILLEHEMQAIDRLWLSNIIQSINTIDAIDWAECFLEISRAEHELLNDPSSVYNNMDECSRNLIRQQVHLISRRTGVGELAIARAAVKLSYGAKENGGVSYFLYDDDGRKKLLTALNKQSVKSPRIVPDPNGRAYLALVCALTAVFFIVAVIWLKNLPLSLLAIPVVYSIASAVLNAIITRAVKPRRLLKLKLDRIPDEFRTLVVIPALLSGKARASQIAAQLEVYGCLEKDDNIDFLLLGDFNDSEHPAEDEDIEIIKAARNAVDRMNGTAGRKKYFYLNRAREYSNGSRRYMGRERKRGAIMALNALLLGGENTFEAHGADAEQLAGRYTYVVTLDADTRILPGTVNKLVAAISHPLNRRREEDGAVKGYAILQPRMELSKRTVTSPFIRLFGGEGGLDNYPTAVSDVFQDFTGASLYGGKGIYDIKAFQDQIEEKLPDNTLLSHDLIEGALAGVGFISDEVFYDGFPATLSAYYKRMERWTRGDWQLLPFIGSALPISKLNRYFMTANLLRSLTAPASLLLILFSIWFNLPQAMLLALLPHFLPALLTLPRVSKPLYQNAIAGVSLLPSTSAVLLSGAFRALKRLKTRENMLEWVTSADAERLGEDDSILYGRIFAILLLPGIFNINMAICAFGFIALFLAGVSWVREMQSPFEEKALSEKHIDGLMRLAKDTWRFFEVYVPENGAGLPPDNVQLNPPNGAAERTSPTNIGLYLLSCISAEKLHILRADEMLRRVDKTLKTVEALPKWHGQLYNWYDTKAMMPMTPKYVSSVDGGNLAACLLALGSALRTDYRENALADRCEALASGMKFETLYDKKRRLFVIGYDVENERPSASHYDLLASEARILSYVAIMLGKVDIKNYEHLGKSVVKTPDGQALLSWSGTMFEYLMPELLMRAPAGSLIRSTNETVVKTQMRFAHEAGGIPWGVSESGYHAFDMQMNYQYRAFGLTALSLRGAADTQVIAPYASMLALPYDPKAASENLIKMTELGFTNEYGLYEAVDYRARHADEAPFHIVYSHMAHHQGMIMTALANALRDNVIANAFMQRPEAEALSLLLEEKESPLVTICRRESSLSAAKKRINDTRNCIRIAYPDALIPDTHLLYGGGTTYFVCASGAGFLRTNGLMVNRFSEDPVKGGDGVFVHIRTKDLSFCATGQKSFPEPVSFRALFDAGVLTYSAKAGALSAKTSLSVSPEDGTLFIRVRLSNQAETLLELDVINCFSVALAAQADMKAHPAFHGLFVESELIDGKALMFTRRSQDEREYPALLHRIGGVQPESVSWETDLYNLTCRDGDPGDARRIANEFPGALGAVLNPCSALCAQLTLSPHETREMFFSIAVVKKEDVEDALRVPLSEDAAVRSEQLAATQARAMLDFLNINQTLYPLLCRASAYLMYPRLPNEARGDAAKRNISQVSGLWAVGVSGDLPIIVVHISATEQLELVREALRAHEFYRMQGVWCDLLLINEYGNDYDQPIRDSLNEIIAASHLRELHGEPGGAYPLEGASLTDTQRALIDAMAALIFSGGHTSFAAQLRAQLKDKARHSDDALSEMPPARKTLPAVERMAFNGYGGFSKDGKRYIIDLKKGATTPAPWCNILANECFGALVSERGCVFVWHGNSRNGRLTPFSNDILSEGFGEAAYLVDPNAKSFASLLPGPGSSPRAFRVTHRAGASEYESGADGLEWKVTQFVDAQWPVKCLLVSFTNSAGRPRDLTLKFFVDWLMGIQQEDARFLTVNTENGVGTARGLIDGLGFAYAPGPAKNARCARMEFLGTQGLKSPHGLAADGKTGLPGDECSVIERGVQLAPGETKNVELLIGWGGDMDEIERLIDKWNGAGGAAARLQLADQMSDMRLNKINVLSPDPIINAMVNRFFPNQVLASRVFGRTGLYQSGGAFGFRDQLQDMLALIEIEPLIVREHIINCAAHQFESGDVMHWWHPERTGVRTRISDDLLFLPYVTAHYIEESGDTSILNEGANYLCDIEIPENREDFYGTQSVSPVREPIHEHCMRAFRHAARFGGHGLPLMGTGDWNDGMNRVGRSGKGESVWLAEFMIATARLYIKVCDRQEDVEYLEGLAALLAAAVEEHGWDGAWYRRAYMDDGRIIGSAKTGEHGCRIDAIAQSWAVMAGLDDHRARQAMDEVYRQLVDGEHGVVKLLTPPFNGDSLNPGYIKGYVPGIRENGGQYTHAACWVVMAFARLNQAERAWEIFEMLLPHNHANNPEKALTYRVEPYVVAADVYGEPPHEGRGGWTWYTGAAAWLFRVAIHELFGYKRTGSRASLNALLPQKWEELSLSVRVGESVYTLTSRRGIDKVTLDGEPTGSDDIELIDDGKEHMALFPIKKP